MRNQSIGITVTLTGISTICFLGFQNCGQVKFSEISGSRANETVALVGPSAATNATDTAEPNSQAQTGVPAAHGVPNVCAGISCDLTPITTKTAVTTILMALGDQVNDQLVIKGVSAQLIAESVVRYTSPKTNPKILFVHDPDSTDESANDPGYVSHRLLGRYDVTNLVPPESGLTDADVAGFDLIWFNNPGYPMGSIATRDVLLRFKGGVVLEGDDLSQGHGFNISQLTGLTNIDNGESVKCNEKTYYTDNNGGVRFDVSLKSNLFTGAINLNANFSYGNDIDLTKPARSDLEILATATGSPADCTDERPAIVRYLK